MVRGVRCTKKWRSQRKQLVCKDCSEILNDADYDKREELGCRTGRRLSLLRCLLRAKAVTGTGKGKVVATSGAVVAKHHQRAGSQSKYLFNCAYFVHSLLLTTSFILHNHPRSLYFFGASEEAPRRFFLPCVGDSLKFS